MSGRELPAAPPEGLAGEVFEFEREELVVFSHPVPGAPPAEAEEDALSPAERAVVERLAEGWSYARVARERGVAVSTVAKQAETAYRKLGVTSRNELVVRLARTPAVTAPSGRRRRAPRG